MARLIYAGFRAGAEWLYQGGLRQTVKSINRFDVYNNNFLEFRYLYYLMSWLVGDQFFPEDVMRVIGGRRAAKTAVGIICCQ